MGHIHLLQTAHLHDGCGDRISEDRVEAEMHIASGTHPRQALNPGGALSCAQSKRIP